MKTIFRYANVGLLTAAIFALGAVAGFGQDVCADADAQTKMGDEFRALYPLRDIENRKKTIDVGKQFLEKYGACESAKELADYLKKTVPLLEESLKKTMDGDAKKALLTRFDTGLKAKNWNEVYGAGKEILVKYPDEFRDVVLVLGSIGLDETAKATPVTTWNEDTLRYAKQAIADLEGGKVFKTYGLSIKDGANFDYKSKDDALGWMNYTIGYILFFDKKDKKQGLSYLYKATQLTSDTKNNPVVYQSIGAFYFDEVKKLAMEVTAREKQQDPNATPEAAKALVDEIKAKVAMVNGTAEAAIDAYARARDLAMKSTTTTKEYKDSLSKTLQDLYNVRFGKMDGFDVFIAATLKKPMPNPLNPVTPISDPEPVVTTTGATGTGVGAANGTGVGRATGTGMGAASGTGVGNANGTGAGGTKPPANTAPSKPVTAPAKPVGATRPPKPGKK